MNLFKQMLVDNLSDRHLVQDFDWTLGEPVIQWGCYSPHPEISCTFGMAAFRKS